jgi:hypothetical protein
MNSYYAPLMLFPTDVVCASSLLGAVTTISVWIVRPAYPA